MVPLAKAGATIFTFHLESISNPIKLIEDIKKQAMKVGIAIKPETEVSQIIPFLPLIDMALIMSVEPGFGGQSFMSISIPKVRNLT